MVMAEEKDFLIPFSGLKLGKHLFEFEIDRSFFNLFDFEDFEDAAVKVSVVLEKKITMLELSFHHKGTVRVPCDLTNEWFDIPVEGDLNLIVKFAQEYNDENEQMLYLPHGEFQLSVMQYIYEMIVLSVPAKRVHPGVADGTLESEALKYLENQFEEHQPKEENINETDPRWDILKQLLTDK